MVSKLLNAFAAVCVATVITQMILFGYFLTQGTINGDTTTKVIALLNGIDITGNRLQQVLRQSEDREQPDFDEILSARKMDSLDMDLRLRSQNELRDENSKMLADLMVNIERFDERRKAFDRRLEELKQGAQEQGLRDLQRILQSLDAAQAKEQLLTMYDDERIDDVVNIVQAMSTDKTKRHIGGVCQQGRNDQTRRDSSSYRRGITNNHTDQSGTWRVVSKCLGFTGSCHLLRRGADMSDLRATGAGSTPAAPLTSLAQGKLRSLPSSALASHEGMLDAFSEVFAAMAVRDQTGAANPRRRRER